MAMSSKKKQKHTIVDTPQVDENMLFLRVSEIIENRKYRAIMHANQETTLMFWEVGQHINAIVLGNKRAEYGKNILTTLPAKLMARYGKNSG